MHFNIPSMSTIIVLCALPKRQRAKVFRQDPVLVLPRLERRWGHEGENAAVDSGKRRGAAKDCEVRLKQSARGKVNRVRPMLIGDPVQPQSAARRARQDPP